MLVLVDATDVSGTLIPSLRNLIGGNPLLAVATKVDLLPKQTRGPREFQGWLRGVMRAKGMVPLETLQVRSEAVVWRKMAQERRAILTRMLLSKVFYRPFSMPVLPSTQFHPPAPTGELEDDGGHLQSSGSHSERAAWPRRVRHRRGQRRKVCLSARPGQVIEVMDDS